MTRSDEGVRLFARVAAAAFGLVSVYTVAVKAPGGELADDWTHTVLHVMTGAVAVYAGWLAASLAPAAAFTVAIAVGYGALGVVGWFVDGLLLEREFRVPLAPADNVFHLLLAVGAVAALVPLAASRGGARGEVA